MNRHQGSLPRLVVTLKSCHHHATPRLDTALVSSRARLITTGEVSEFVDIIKACIPGSEQQALSLQMSARDEFG